MNPVTSHPEKPTVAPALVLGVGVLSVSTGAILVRYAQQERRCAGCKSTASAYRLLCERCRTNAIGDGGQNTALILRLKAWAWSISRVRAGFIAY